ncbi:MAG: NAD-dependent epimerase/dehydratase family protein [Acidobacteria bacterium]|nr:NAD-dependent epimerase/dehydratase family protein [Acidobacteriota bacterium]
MGETGANPPAILVTGISGTLGQRLVARMPECRFIGIDVRPPASCPGEFHPLDLGRESSCQELLQVMRSARPQAVIHLAFVVDEVSAGVTDRDRMWRINVGGTARVMEAIAVLNRLSADGEVVRKFIFPSSVSAYGPDLQGAVTEDCPLDGHTLPYAVHKREADLVVQQRAESLGGCATWILRPHIFAGSTVENYILAALRGIPSGKSRRALRWRAAGKRMPILLPRGRRYLENHTQFVHIDDMARLLGAILQRKASGSSLEVLNVAGRGSSLSVRECAQITGTEIRQVPSRAMCRLLLQMAWRFEFSSFPPEAFPYLTGSQVMDTSRLQSFLGAEYREVIQFTNEGALKQSVQPPTQPEASPASRQPVPWP